jgi:hypothetical protein
LKSVHRIGVAKLVVVITAWGDACRRFGCNSLEHSVMCVGVCCPVAETGLCWGC